MSSPEQEVRAGLLHHYDALMNGYKVYILTLAVAVLTWVQLWFGVLGSNRMPVIIWIMSFALGVIFTGIFFSFARFFWLGKVVEFAIYMLPLGYPPVLPLIDQLEERIFICARCAAEGKGPRKMARGLRWLARRGRDLKALSYEGLIIALSLTFVLFWSIIIFRL